MPDEFVEGLRDYFVREMINVFESSHPGAVYIASVVRRYKQSSPSLILFSSSCSILVIQE